MYLVCQDSHPGHVQEDEAYRRHVRDMWEASKEGTMGVYERPVRGTWEGLPLGSSKSHKTAR